MKFIPYLRFFLALCLGANFIFQEFYKVGPDSLGELAIPVSGIVLFTFILYCIIEGFQELKEKELVDASIFRGFGIFFQIFIFGVGLLILFNIIGEPYFLWTSIALVASQIALIPVLIVDVQKIRLS